MTMTTPLNPTSVKMTCQLVAECALHTETHSVFHLIRIHHQVLIRNQYAVQFIVESSLIVSASSATDLI